MGVSLVGWARRHDVGRGAGRRIDDKGPIGGDAGGFLKIVGRGALALKPKRADRPPDAPEIGWPAQAAHATCQMHT